MSIEGYKKRGTDVVGYWNPDKGVIHCIPLAAKVFDGNIQKARPSTLIIVELVDPCECVYMKEDDDNEQVTTSAGDRVGIWAKPGMAPIATHFGEKVLLRYDRDEKGEIKTKKMKKPGMNPMKLFDVLSARNPMKLIPVIEDTRVESAAVRTLLTGPKPAQRKVEAPSQSDNMGNTDDDIPF
jgi:hypothetical protein